VRVGIRTRRRLHQRRDGLRVEHTALIVSNAERAGNGT
jgi:hypothetical protein